MNIKPVTKEQLKRLPDKIERLKWIRAYKNFHGWSEKPPVFVSSNPNAPTNNP